MQPIQFISTRISPGGVSEGPVGIETAIARGMPPDGGLYVPTSLPPLSPRIFDPAPLSYLDLALLVLTPFFAGWENGSLKAILEKAYGDGHYFDTPDIAPLVPLPGLSLPGAAESGVLAGGALTGGALTGGALTGEGLNNRGLDGRRIDAGSNASSSKQASLYLLELFHGKTCAFKDMALSVLGGLLRESLDRLGRKEPVLVLTATSGDTGSAALEGLSSVEGIHTAVFYPRKGTSEIQRLQMTTTSSSGRFVAGIEGNFDDAQNAVKGVFARAAKGQGALAGVHLSSANSINIGRLLPQIVYYVAAWRALASRDALGEGGLMHVAVPTGNFGDILAAKFAKEMGLPIGKLICASNANKVLADFFATGVYDRRRELVMTESPSMDILVSSNLERLLFMAAGGNQARISAQMGELAARGWFDLDDAEQAYLSDFSSGWCSDYSAKSAIAEVWKTCSILVDPHTATAVEVAMRTSDRLGERVPIVIAATASPFKFPRACLEALNGVSDEESGEAKEVGDLVLAERLSALTGRPVPESIGRLLSKPIVHDKVFAVNEIEASLAEYARAAMGGLA